MRYLSFTIITFLIFLFTLMCEGFFSNPLGTQEKASVSSSATRNYHAVKQGISPDGIASLTKVGSAPKTPLRLKVHNHDRTLRAFIGVAKDGVETLYIESVKPHEYYRLEGDFVISSAHSRIEWTNTTVIEFHATSTDVGFLRMSINVETLNVVQQTASNTEQAGTQEHSLTNEVVEHI